MQKVGKTTMKGDLAQDDGLGYSDFFFYIQRFFVIVCFSSNIFVCFFIV